MPQRTFSSATQQANTLGLLVFRLLQDQEWISQNLEEATGKGNCIMMSAI